VLVLPEGLDVKTAAAIPEAWGTAYQILNFVGGLTSGDTVLVCRAFQSVVCSVAPCDLQIACHRSTLLAVVSGRRRLRYGSRPTVAVCCAGLRVTIRVLPWRLRARLPPACCQRQG